MATLHIFVSLTNTMLLYVNNHYFRERKDLKVQLEEMVFRDLLVCQDLEDLLAHLERTETRYNSIFGLFVSM